jgi:hypothetical protein
MSGQMVIKLDPRGSIKQVYVFFPEDLKGGHESLPQGIMYLSEMPNKGDTVDLEGFGLCKVTSVFDPLPLLELELC